MLCLRLSSAAKQNLSLSCALLSGVLEGMDPTVLPDNVILSAEFLLSTTPYLVFDFVVPRNVLLGPSLCVGIRVTPLLHTHHRVLGLGQPSIPALLQGML